MKILLTGSNGFLGKYLYKTLSSEYSVFTLNRSNSDFNIDLSNQMVNFSDSFDCIIHSVGLAHFNFKSVEESDLFFKVNTIGTINLLKSLEVKNLPKYFVFISSVSVYGLTQGIGIDENFPLKATDPYGLSKIKAEKIILNWCTEKNVICTILRLPLIVGSNPPGNLRSMINSIKHGYYFNISNGNVKKSMVLAEDVANYIIQSAKVGGIYNLTDGYHPSFNELSKFIAEQLGSSKIYNLSKKIARFLAIIGDIVGDKFPLNTHKFEKITSSLTFDDTRARNNFDWNPKKVLNNFTVN
jgi:nucleoside-diphosphate-sugar epimerase